MNNVLNMLYIEVDWPVLEMGVCISKGAMYSIDKICAVGYMYNIDHSNLYNIRGSASAQMSTVQIKKY